MVDSVVSRREIYEDYAGDFPCFKAIFDVLGEVQHLGSTRFAGAEASLLWYKDMFDNGSRPVPGTPVPGYPTDESGTRFRFVGSITRIEKFMTR